MLLSHLFGIFNNVTKSCDLKGIEDNFSNITRDVKDIYERDDNGKGIVLHLIDVFCKKDNGDEINTQVSRSLSTLTTCVDPNYVNHVRKFENVFLRTIDILCESKNELKRAADDIIYIRKALKKYFNKRQKLFQFMGCILSQNEVREVVADKSLFSNFTLELLDGNAKNCEFLNKIKMCMIETVDRRDKFILFVKPSMDIIINSLNCKIDGQSNSSNKTIL